MPCFVIPRTFLTVAKIQETQIGFMRQKKIVPKNDFSANELMRLLSSDDEVLVFETLHDAKFVAIMLARELNDKPQSVAADVKQYASAVIFELEGNAEHDSVVHSIAPDILANFADYTSIPFYIAHGSAVELQHFATMFTAFKMFPDLTINIPSCRLCKITTAAVLRAHFQNAHGEFIISNLTADLLEFPGLPREKSRGPKL